jgi:predicted PurR-regulated permease PerM
VSLLPGGPLIVWGPLVVYLGATGHMGRAILLTLWSVLVVGAIDNFIRPLLIGGRAEIPTLLLFFGMLGGMQAYGFLGIFLAPALIAVLFAFIAIYEEQYAPPRI